MRNSVMCVLAIGFFSANPVIAGDSKPAEATAEQLDAAKKTYAKLGAEYDYITDPMTKQSFHIFHMPNKTTDADLKGLPNLSFRFTLTFYGSETKVTDAGLKEFKKLKNLAGLCLDGAKDVTDDGLRELKELKNLARLDLTGTSVTNAGVESLKEALPKCKILK